MPEANNLNKHYNTPLLIPNPTLFLLGASLASDSWLCAERFCIIIFGLK